MQELLLDIDVDNGTSITPQKIISRHSAQYRDEAQNNCIWWQAV